METFIDEIIADIDWRVSQLATLKSIPIRYSFSPEHKELQIKYTVPAIYAIWEGFVKSSFIIYSNHLNTLSIGRSEIAMPLLTHQLDSECDFNNPRINFDSKQRMVSLLDSLLTDIVTIKPSVPTESNVNFKVLNKILERFCIDKVSDDYEQKLNKLLLFRNKIAHGENSISVNLTHVTEFISTVENLMLDIAINVEQNERLGTYKR
ncbi:MAG: hypothetical protein DCF13_05510 [Flavobacteriaceae bacterium]|nr:MAG: hypothetical protein DCF13_05510 [Flavobacteriaceae bacterium]